MAVRQNISVGGEPSDLIESIRGSEQVLRQFRDRRKEFAKKFAGPYYGNRDYEFRTAEREPFNILYQLILATIPALMIEPNVEIRVQDRELKEFGLVFEKHLQKRLGEIDYRETCHRAIQDALFQYAVTKVGVSPADDAGRLDAPYIETVDIDDHVIDMNARELDDVQYQGNRYLVTMEWAMDSGYLEGDGRDRFESYAWSAFRKKEQARASSQNKNTAQLRPFQHEIELIDVYLPRQKKIVVLPGDLDLVRQKHLDGGYLRERAYKGPDRGPYTVWGLTRVPQQIIPLPLSAVVFDLIELINVLGGKEARRAKNAKNVMTYTLGHDQDADAVRTAPDGSAVGVADVAQLQMQRFGTTDPQGFNAITWFNNWANRLAGNPDLLGGAVAGADTLGQEQILMGGIGRRIGMWRQQVLNRAKQDLEKLAWYEWNDPTGRDELKIPLPMGAGTMTAVWDTGHLEGDLDDYGLDLSPFDSPDRSPEEEYTRMRRWIAEIVSPLAQVGMAQGVSLNVREVAERAGRRLGINVDGLLVGSGLTEDARSSVGQAVRPGGGGPAPSQEGPTVNISQNRTEQGIPSAQGPRGEEGGRPPEP